jgi:hypothetical protein
MVPVENRIMVAVATRANVSIKISGAVWVVVPVVVAGIGKAATVVADTVEVGMEVMITSAAVL